jgi:UPF0716 protein FxsA
MLFRLLLLFIAVPLVELYLLLRLADITSVGTTILVVVVTGIVGSLLAKQQGWIAWLRFREAMLERRIPSAEIADGLMVVFAAALLLTPGLLTDLVGFLLLIPPSRRWIRNRILKRMSQNVRVETRVFSRSVSPDDSDTIDATFHHRQSPSGKLPRE